MSRTGVTSTSSKRAAAGGAGNAVTLLRGSRKNEPTTADSSAEASFADDLELQEALERLCSGGYIEPRPGIQALWVRDIRSKMPMGEADAEAARERVAACKDLNEAGLPAPPRPVLPTGLDRMPVRQRLIEIQKYISALQYNYTVCGR